MFLTSPIFPAFIFWPAPLPVLSNKRFTKGLGWLRPPKTLHSWVCPTQVVRLRRCKAGFVSLRRCLAGFVRLARCLARFARLKRCLAGFVASRSVCLPSLVYRPEKGLGFYSSNGICLVSALFNIIFFRLCGGNLFFSFFFLHICQTPTAIFIFR